MGVRADLGVDPGGGLEREGEGVFGDPAGLPHRQPARLDARPGAGEAVDEFEGLPEEVAAGLVGHAEAGGELDDGELRHQGCAWPGDGDAGVAAVGGQGRAGRLGRRVQGEPIPRPARSAATSAAGAAPGAARQGASTCSARVAVPEVMGETLAARTDTPAPESPSTTGLWKRISKNFEPTPVLRSSWLPPHCEAQSVATVTRRRWSGRTSGTGAPATTYSRLRRGEALVSSRPRPGARPARPTEAGLGRLDRRRRGSAGSTDGGGARPARPTGGGWAGSSRVGQSTKTVGMAGSPRCRRRARAGSSARARSCRARASPRGSAPTTSPLRTRGTSSARSSASDSGGLADPDHLGLGEPVGRRVGVRRTSGRRCETLSVLLLARPRPARRRSSSRATSL